jgi:hypothetical protein
LCAASPAGLSPRLRSAIAAALNAATVTETVTEFHASGDCNGDGRLDAIVLDKATGNVRVGYQNANGTLTWANAVPSGVADATSVAVGRFLHASRDSVAVTSEEFNRVHVLRLETPGAVSAPIVTHPPHGGLSMLVGWTISVRHRKFPGARTRLARHRRARPRHHAARSYRLFTHGSEL